MSFSVKVDDTYCRMCGDEDIYMDLKEEPSLYKVGASCHSCEYDYGVLDCIDRTDIDHTDDVWAMAEDSVEQYLE